MTLISVSDRVQPAGSEAGGSNDNSVLRRALVLEKKSIGKTSLWVHGLAYKDSDFTN